MNYRDAALLNDSIRGVGDAILKAKMLQQRDQEITATREERNQARSDTLDYRTKQLQATGDANAEKQKENLRRVWNDTADMIGRWVKDGIMPPDVAQQQIQSAYDKMPTPQKESLADHPLVQALQSGQPLWKTPQKPAPALTPSKVGNRDVMIGPGGSVHYTDEFSPADKVELDDVTRGLRDIDREARANAGAADADKARALNAQRKVLETRKQALMGKYRQGQQPTEEKPAAGAPADSDRVIVEDKNGKRFRLPRAQLQDALKQGFKQVE